MRATEHFGLNAPAAGTYLVTPDGAGAPYLFGGRYQLAVRGASSGNSIQVAQVVEGTRVLVGEAIEADGVTTYDLPPGQYALVAVGTVTGGADLTRVPVSE